MPKLGSVTAPTMTSTLLRETCCWTCTPVSTASALYARALSIRVWYTRSACSRSATPTSTPPASVLCRMSSETIFITTGKPMSAAKSAASAADWATPSRGSGTP